ncbi:complement factor H-related protein 4-like isoform X1 [Dendropsophus ebraccatus]|uniref:complement factor H-related protein 4-like isoform X1 n=1 Tax=Dendropsophus ebraccatus TaxID=150705 RepID=UPI003831BF77
MSPSGFFFLLISAMSCCAAPQYGSAPCGPPPDIRYGDIPSISKSVYRSGESVEYICLQYYTLNGNSVARCINGVWTNAPECLEPCSVREKDMKENNLRVKWSPDSKLYLPHGDFLEFGCQSGYEAPFGTEMRSYCLHRKLNYPKCFKRGFCELDQSAMFANNIHYSTSSIVDYGETIIFQCYEGTMAENNLEAKCELGKITYPKCVPGKKCDIPTIKHGQMDHPYPYYYQIDPGRSLDYRCDKNYLSHQREYWGKIWCTDNGWNPEPKCSRQCSSIKAAFENADLINPQREYLEGETATFRCRYDYLTPNGRDNGERTCLPNGEFTPAKCSKICRAPELPNGKFIPKKDHFEFGEYLQYECNNGYMIKNRKLHSTAQCLSGGWSEMPSCIPITCTYKRVSYKDGHIIKYTCPKGQTPESEFGQCFYYGWGPPPDCQGEKIDQSGATDPPQGVYEYEEYADQSVATDPPPGVTENEEKRRKCPLAYHPINAKIKDPKEAYYSNDNVTMTCIGGYRIHGSPVVRCIEGKWEQPPECIQNPCAEPPDVMHVTVVEKKKTFYQGEKFKYECKKGFRLSGEDSASCVKGEWMNIPSCVATSCTSPPTVPNSKINGSIKASYESGETCTYECNADYSMGRSSTGAAMCENAQWIKVPVCKKIGAQCGPPPVVQYGDTISLINPSYNSSDSVEYKCSEYYTLTGNKNVTCLNGFWDEAPVCLEPCIVREEDMEDNNIQLKSGNKKTFVVHGESLEFDCKSGHEAPPDIQMRIVCEGQKLLEYPRCFKEGFCVLDRSAMITNNIYHNENAVLENGERFRFQCNKGTIPENNLEAKCEWKKINYPKCVTAA